MAAVDIVTANEFTFSPSSFIAAYTEDLVTDVVVTETTANAGSLTTSPHSTSLASSLINANKEVAAASVVSGYGPISIAGYGPLITPGFAPVTAIASANGAAGAGGTAGTGGVAYDQTTCGEGCFGAVVVRRAVPLGNAAGGGSGGNAAASAAVAGVQGVAADGVPGQVAPGTPGVSPGNTGPLAVSGTVVDFLGQVVTDTRTVTKTTTKTTVTVVVLVLTYGTFRANSPNRAAALATVALIFSKVKEYLESL